MKKTIRIEIPEIAKSGNRSHTIMHGGFIASSNTSERMKWFKYIARALDNDVTYDVVKDFGELLGRVAIGKKSFPYWKPKQQKRHVKIKSYRVRKLDKINLYQAHKPVEDSLLPYKVVISRVTGKEKKHYGLGLIFDDCEEYCDLEVIQEKVNHYNEQKTVIEITGDF